MRRKKPPILKHRIERNKVYMDCFTHQGVLQRRTKLQCNTPFLMSNFVRSDVRFDTDYCLIYGCFDSMAFCVSNTCCISSFTCFTSAA